MFYSFQRLMVHVFEIGHFEIVDTVFINLIRKIFHNCIKNDSFFYMSNDVLRWRVKIGSLIHINEKKIMIRKSILNLIHFKIIWYGMKEKWAFKVLHSSLAPIRFKWRQIEQLVCDGLQIVLLQSADLP